MDPAISFMNFTKKPKLTLVITSLILLFATFLGGNYMTLESEASSGFSIDLISHSLETDFVGGVFQSTLSLRADLLEDGVLSNRQVTWTANVYRLDNDGNTMGSGAVATEEIEGASLDETLSITTTRSMMRGLRVGQEKFSNNRFRYNLSVEIGGVEGGLEDPINLGNGNQYLGIVDDLMTIGELEEATGINDDTTDGGQRMSHISDDNYQIPFLKFEHDGKTLFVAQKPVKSYISWDAINGGSSDQDSNSTSSAVYGAMDCQHFLIQLLFGQLIKT